MKFGTNILQTMGFQEYDLNIQKKNDGKIQDGRHLRKVKQ